MAPQSAVTSGCGPTEHPLLGATLRSQPGAPSVEDGNETVLNFELVDAI